MTMKPLADRVLIKVEKEQEEKIWKAEGEEYSKIRYLCEVRDFDFI